MTTPRRLLALLAPLLVAATAAVTLTGHAASLGVTSAKLDTFAADQPASTTTSSTPGQTAPKLIDVTDSDTSGAADGTFEQGDWIEFHLDQSIASASLPQGPVTVQLVEVSGHNNNDRLRISGILSADTDLGSSLYLSGNNRTASFASTVSLTNGGQSIRVTLGSCTPSSICGADDLEQGIGNVTFTLASTIKGTNGLSVTGSVTKTGYRVF